MTEQERAKLVRDPEYFLANVDAISRGEFPPDTRKPKKRIGVIERDAHNFNEIFLADLDNIATGKVVVV